MRTTATRPSIRAGWRLVLPVLVVVGLELAACQAAALPLWELTGTKGRILLLGSIHFLRPADYPLAPAINAAFEAADVVVMELDMDDLDPTATATTVAELARDSRGRNLQELVGQPAWRAVSAKARSLGMDLEPLAEFEPWYVAIVVSQLRLAQLDFDPGYGIEARLTTAAKQAGKEIRGLETVREQLESLDSLSPAAQTRFLESTLDEAATIDDEIDKMLAAWKAGDARALDRDLLKEVRNQPEVYRRLITERNRNFSRAIAALATDSRNYLVVVGALHLVGPDSVLRMLDAAGYEARQVR